MKILYIQKKAGTRPVIFEIFFMLLLEDNKFISQKVPDQSRD